MFWIISMRCDFKKMKKHHFAELWAPLANHDVRMLVLMHFGMKSTLKNNHNHTPKQIHVETPILRSKNFILTSINVYIILY